MACRADFLARENGVSVKWHSDNQGAVRIVDIGSPNSELHSIALDIFHNGFLGSLMLVLMKLAMSWISMTSVQPRFFFFAHLDSIWGPHTVDRFANASNAHLPRFNSRFRVPGSEDAFSVKWTGENNWLVPPVHCII